MFLWLNLKNLEPNSSYNVWYSTSDLTVNWNVLNRDILYVSPSVSLVKPMFSTFVPFLEVLKLSRLTNAFLSRLFSVLPLPKVSTGGRPIYYVSSRRDVFTPMKLPKYTLPKVECLIHTCSMGTKNLPRTVLFPFWIITSIDVSFWQNPLFPEIWQALLRMLMPAGASRYYPKLAFSRASMTIKRFIQSSSPRSLKHAPGDPRAAWGRWNSLAASMWFCCLGPNDKLNLRLIRIFAVRRSCEEKQGGWE